LVVLALFALFWGGSLLAQGYFYNEPADRMPLRALAAALAVGSFLAAWVLIDRRAPGKYDTFFEFAPYSTVEYAEFDAVRWTVDPAAAGKGKVAFRTDDAGAPAETVVRFKRPPGNKTAPFRENGTGPAFRLNDSQGMTAAIVVTGPDDAPVRFKAATKADPRTGAVLYAADRRFTEEKGSRYVMGDQPGQMFVPSTAAVAGALALNLLHFVVWFLALWLLLRFEWGHAAGAAVALGLVAMLAVMPLLFKPNRIPKVAPVPNPPAEKAELVIGASGV
jgi:hypothetical protein